MQEKDNATKIEKVNSLIKKWALVLIILTIYFFISYKIIDSLAQPVTINNFCGTGYLASIIVHFFLAFVVTIILAIRLFNNKKTSLIVSIIIIAVVILMPFISYSLM